MKITIDTKEDTHEELRKIIKMLSSLVGEKEVMSNQSDMFSDDDNGKEESTGMFNMFSQDKPDALETSETTDPETTTDEEKPEEDKKETDVDLGMPDFEEYD